jgi:uncharacterized protein
VETQTLYIYTFVTKFASILWEAFPFVVLGAFIAGLLEELVPQQLITRLVPKITILAVIMGALLGLVFPMCECGIVPIMRRLLRKGLPLGTCVAYMLAGPIINLIVISSTAVAFGPHGIGWEMVGLRVGLGFVTAVITGLIVQRMYLRDGVELLMPLARPIKASSTKNDDGTEKKAPAKPWSKRIVNITTVTLHDFVDIMTFLTIGAFLSALVKQAIDMDDIESLSGVFPGIAIAAAMILAVLMCLCSEADAFVAASFTKLAFSAKLSFLVLGPMFDLKLLLMFTRVFRRKIVMTIIFSVVIQVFTYSMLVHYLLQLPPSRSI